jgi:hypothetical protein
MNVPAFSSELVTTNNHWRQTMKYPKPIRAAVASTLLCGASLACATPMTWQLSGVQFDDQTSASGTLRYDAGTDTLLSYSITVEGGALPAFTYSEATASNTCMRIAGGNNQSGGCNTNDAPNELYLGSSDGSQFLELYLSAALTDAGDPVPLLTSGQFQSYEIDSNYDYRTVSAGRLVSVADAADVPEPGSLALMGIAMTGMFGAARRRKQRK